MGVSELNETVYGEGKHKDEQAAAGEGGSPIKISFWDPNASESSIPASTYHLQPPESSSSHPNDSPYPEVRASVQRTDDPSLPVSTVRAWVLGVLVSILLSGINQFFIYRYPNVFVQGLVAQLAVHPLGLLMAKLPTGKGWEWIDPGPWNVKEHTLVYIMANVSAGSAYATDIIATQRFFYGQRWGWGYNLLIVLSTQMIGFSFAGVLHDILVTPATMIWPSTLVNTALFNALHFHSKAGPYEERIKSKSRQLFFYVNTGAMFAWSFFPSYIFSALSCFDWVTWIRPDSQVINLLFGYQSGAGMSFLTFDWGMMSAVANPLATPWWVTANVLAGFLFFIWFLGPILYYANVFNAKYLPFSSGTIFDNTGAAYNVTKVLTQAMELDVTAYKDYSPVYMTLSMAISYGMNFAAITATLVHAIIFFRHQVWHHLRHRPSRSDIHATLASAYRSVPGYWYLITFLINLGLAIGAIRGWPTQLPVWALFLALALAGVMVLPIGLIQAVTNMQIGLNVVSEMIVGYLVPGKPVAMMIFKTYGYITTTQGLGFVQDLKVAHYMHVPPRTVFIAQIISAIIGSIVQLGVQAWLFGNVPDICSASAPQWWCPHTRTFFSASVLYGLVGPRRLFSDGGEYSPLLWFFFIGAAMPVVTWGVVRRWPTSGWRYVCWPVVFGCMSLLPPYLPINFISFCVVGWVTQYWIRRRHFKWWSKYNHIMSAAWTCGYALCVILIFFALQLPKSGKSCALSFGEGMQTWWGNTVYANTLNGQGGSAAAANHLDEGETFGMGIGSWA
ncbi:OPT family small oligopeptide transporter [Cryptococcus sp. DSM 104549]